MKKRVLWCLAFLLIAGVVFFSPSCGKGTPKSELAKKKPDERWFRYISAHTSGDISRQSAVRVLFVNNIVDKEKDKKLPAGDDIIEFEPEIKGKTEWTSNRELVFTPGQELQPGTEYAAVLHLDKWIDLPGGLGDYYFIFSVIKQDMEILVDGLSASAGAGTNIQELRGVLNTADTADNSLVEKVLNASQDNQDLKISWQHDDDGKAHRFIIAGVQRKEQQSEVTLDWDAAPIGCVNKGTRRVFVPNAGLFKITEVQTVQADQSYILVRFSDSLQAKQNLSGLIRVTGRSTRYEIDGNVVRVYPGGLLSGQVQVMVDSGIKNSSGKRLDKSSSHMVFFETISPAVRFVGKGVILPDNESLTVPFEAVNLHSVQVTAFQVYSNNMGQFFQLNNLEGSDEMRRVGRYLWRKTVKLSNDPEVTGKWSRFSIDVTSLFKTHPGSLFRLTLSFNRGNSTYHCPANGQQVPPKKEDAYENFDDWKQKDASSWDYSEDYYYYGRNESDWAHRNDPCHDAYYKQQYNKDKVIAERNFIAANTGIIAKQGENNELVVVTTDIRTAQPVGADIKAYNFQDQVIGQGSSDRSGFAVIKVSGKPFYISAKNGSDVGYVKVNTDSALPLSHFDVSGDKVSRGIKGYIYGERGVWRPGDTLYLTFVLEDRGKTLPANHPVMLELYDPNGQLVQTLKPTKSLDYFYAFQVTTNESAPTGNWKARAVVGGLFFDKTIKIETVVPNRLKIAMDFGREELSKKDMPVQAAISSQWLHGAPASNLKFDVTARFSTRPTRFARFQDYEFDDPTCEYPGGEQSITEGTLDAKGKSSFPINLGVTDRSPGILNASFESRVFEEGGGFSIDRVSVPFHPYTGYIGIKTPKGDEARGMLLTDIKHAVKIASVDPSGKPVSREKIEVSIYKIQWKWWWDKSGESLAQYAAASAVTAIQQGVIATKEGLGEWQFEIKYPDWGRYLIRARDLETGHCTGKVVYIDWPGWAGRAQEEKGVGATRLNFTTDRQQYKVGEKAIVYLPDTVQGRALVSLENGSRVLEQRWVDSSKGNNKFEIECSREMSPNFYVHVSLLQPHRDKKSDVPIRLYGILPILVEDPQTQLQPQLETPDQYRPNQDIKIKISEKNKRAMTYTIAVVDEGLLGLTRFKTPDLRSEFYKREALGVTTWDMFDYVVGAYGGQLERILALGGDEGMDKREREKKKRFPPVVQFLGPFSLAPGKNESHFLKLQPYIGEVRVMVVAGHDGAYGYADKSVPVKEDLMILSSLPRVAGPGEELDAPLSVFVMNPKLKTVDVNIETGDLFTVTENSRKTLTFDQPGDQVVTFRLKTKAKTGTGRIVFRAAGGSFSAQEEIQLPVRTTNPKTVSISKGQAGPNMKWAQEVKPFGLENTNKLTLEVSALPPLNLEKRLDYLIGYPHGCLEQTVSSIFPQIYLKFLVKLDKNQLKQIEEYVNAAVNKLRFYQLSTGGFAYWPSGGSTIQADPWATNYAGHFLVEAVRMGYYVPSEMLSRWEKYQSAAANSWTAGSGARQLIQAYRLYTLALAKKPDLGAMNRLREASRLETAAAYQLAAAFNLVGQRFAAEDLLTRTASGLTEYRELSGTYGSTFRDRALILDTLVHLGKLDAAGKIIAEITKSLASDNWYSTQETAFALMAAAGYYQASPQPEKFEFKLSVGKENFDCESAVPVFKKAIEKFPASGIVISITNPSKVTLYTTLYNEGVPPAGEEKETSDRLSLKIDYLDTERNPIEVTELTQGEDFIAEVIVTNPTDTTFDNLILNHIFPSGWQIHNPHFDSDRAAGALYDYQDIRDDRVYTYFSLRPGQRKVFNVLLNASYCGKFYMPGVIAEAMYDAGIHAVKKGKWVEVVKENL